MSAEEQTTSIQMPCDKTLQYAVKTAIQQDKPIMLDYYLDSMKDSVCIGKLSEKENIIFKSKDEYTSPIVNISKSSTDYICETENSIYLISSVTKIKKLSAK